jgi:mRNA-degrading endonuclease RelE of RelBE toxin-antitoxin system
MRIELSHSSIKFLEKIDEKTKVIIKEKINFLRNQITELGVIPIKSLDIKSLKGQGTL